MFKDTFLEDSHNNIFIMDALDSNHAVKESLDNFSINRLRKLTKLADDKHIQLSLQVEKTKKGIRTMVVLG